MTTYPDLSAYEYTAEGTGLNIGWLGADAPYPTGEVDEEVVACLEILASESTNVIRGLHDCELCDVASPIHSVAANGADVVQGTGEIWVESEVGFFVAPTLVIHYIDAHNYRPPDQFVRAVARSCPS